MLIYNGNDEYVYHTLSGKEIEITKDEIQELMVVSHNQKILMNEELCKNDARIKNLLQEIEDYADSIDNDINTIDNFDMACCDEREAETLKNVFNQLEKFLKQHRNSGSTDS